MDSHTIGEYKKSLTAFNIKKFMLRVFKDIFIMVLPLIIYELLGKKMYTEGKFNWMLILMYLCIIIFVALSGNILDYLVLG